MLLLTLSVSLPGLRPPHCSDPINCKKASTVQLAIFYGALYTLAVGTGGTKPNISTIAGLALSILIFLAGSRFYRHKVPSGSPFTRMARVIVAALRKWSVPASTDPKELYELDLEEYNKKGKFRIDSTPTLRFLNKACVQTGSTTDAMLSHPSGRNQTNAQNDPNSDCHICSKCNGSTKQHSLC
ncbi:hypothetical protein Vadar_024914 [Vaccinium darrowii]|uniref:Uncharacterized protein n=1 Tax=Vaccinium darrowii TaxID=229202 RepID=A0ACB7XTM7_9ERIC|nr:hypothetical protein Vadar_024914 [Vaccinium darrowii]